MEKQNCLNFAVNYTRYFSLQLFHIKSLNAGKY